MLRFISSVGSTLGILPNHDSLVQLYRKARRFDPNLPIREENRYNREDYTFLFNIWQNIPITMKISFATASKKFQTDALNVEAFLANDVLANGQPLPEPDPTDYNAYTTYAIRKDNIRKGYGTVIRRIQVLGEEVRNLAIKTYLPPGIATLIYAYLQAQLTVANTYLNQHQARDERIAEALLTLRVAAGQLGTDWAQGKVLGGGSYGTATVFLRQNSDGVVVDRVVVKNCRADINNDILWNDNKTVPTEVVAMRRLAYRGGSEHAVRLRSWKMENNKRSYLLYMDFCEHGDLWSVMDEYAKSGQGWVPEPFAWHVLEAMTKAGLLMLQGDVYNREQNWVPIVHRDLKPGNVFLASNDTDQYRHYPLPKVGDFGMAVFPRNPKTQYALNRQTHYMAPELCNANIEGRLGAFATLTKISEKSDVWGVGFTLWSLLTGKMTDLPYHAAQYPNGQFKRPTTLTDIVPNRYSPALRQVIEDCLEYHPDNRPTFEELLDTVENHTGILVQDTRGDLSRGLRFATVDLEERDKMPVRYSRDAFELGRQLRSILGAEAPPPPPPKSPRPAGPATTDEELFGSPGQTFAKRRATDAGGGSYSKRRRVSGGGGRPSTSARAGASRGGTVSR